MPSKGSAEWNGDLQSGRGEFLAGDSITGNYSFKSRFEDGEGANPEQLIGAAHAACFSMALSNMLSEAGNVPGLGEDRGLVTLKIVDGDPTITKIALTTVGKVPGIDEDDLQGARRSGQEGLPGQQGPRRRGGNYAGRVAGGVGSVSPWASARRILPGASAGSTWPRRTRRRRRRSTGRSSAGSSRICPAPPTRWPAWAAAPSRRSARCPTPP